MNQGLTQHEWRIFGDLTAKANPEQMKVMVDIINNKLVLLELAAEKKKIQQRKQGEKK